MQRRPDELIQEWRAVGAFAYALTLRLRHFGIASPHI